MVRLTVSQHSPVVRYHGCTAQSEHYAPGRIVREEELGNPLGQKPHDRVYTVSQPDDSPNMPTILCIP